ncbi:PREDICTED: F-box/kelch-repeat protein At4g33290-like [Camelina sativa]|uniref:F-box/kelch-repeat protein At4g33290-like n=1 Tax=Camelina sativa TaxID=90675 RepID=A0ABM0SLR5_CAMSA|nr:PREDICTED: F-box/kelch-repeat protein At4g33290-like [Camelina sativa]
MKKKKMTILSLPMDLVADIVSRLPMKSMRAVRLTCRTLNTLSQSSSFTKLQIGKEAAATSEGETRMIMLMDCNLILIRVVFKGFDIDPSTEQIGKLTCLNDSDQVAISQVFHYEGLVLCISKYGTSFVVWNPYLGQTRWIEPRCTYRNRLDEYDSFSYALGYENKESCHSYKLLRFIDYAYKHLLRYEIYDFDSDLWTDLDVRAPHWRILFHNRGVSLEGYTYFCDSERYSRVERNHGINDHIICFDYTSERFGPLLHLPFSAGFADYVTLSSVREEKLAALLSHKDVNPYENDIWITTTIEPQNVSWSKFLAVDTEPHVLSIKGSFFIDEEKKVVMCVNKKRHWNRHTLDIVGDAGGYFRELDVGEPDCSNCRPHVCAYVPSSVQIKQPARGQRKQESF